MNYNKNLISGYIGIQLFIQYLIYFFLLIIIFTDISQIYRIIYSSLTLYTASFAIFYFFLREYNFYLNVPNQITLFRFVINIFILILILNIEIYDYTLLFLLSFISLILDGLDGYVSRYLNQTSKFGEIFDQEVDNFLILILSISLILNHNYIYYIIIVPFYRYVFQILVKIGVLSKDDLPYSLMRKLICVLITINLILCNSFNTVESFNTLLYVIILLLTYSFIKDTVWLYRRKNA